MGDRPSDGYGRIRTHRLFVAIALPPSVCDAVAALVGRVRAEVGDERPGVRWVRLEGLHLTLRFLGATTPERLAAVEEAVRASAASCGPIDIVLDGAGAFPSAAHPRVLWLGVAGETERLARLATDLEARLATAGWPAEGRPFTPHLSVARTDGARSGPRTAAVLTSLAASLDAGWTANQLTLFESHVGGGPARYDALLEVPLTG